MIKITNKNFLPLALESADFLKHMMHGITLRPYQIRAAIHIALVDYQLLSFATGMGKTVSVIAGLEAKRRLGKNIRILYLCPLAGMKQVKRTFQNHTTFNILTLTGSAEGMESFNKKVNPDVDVLIINYEAFDNPQCLELVKELVHQEVFNTAVCDEAHVFTNIYSSNRNFFIANVITRMTYRYFITATPLISDSIQYATIIALMYNDMPRVNHYLNQIKDGSYQVGRVPHLVQFKEREKEFDTELHLIDAPDYNKTCYGVEIFKHTRGGKIPAVEQKVKELVASEQGNILIYCNYKFHHKYLENMCRALGKSVGVISSDTDKEKVQSDYLEGKYNCIIYSIATELNLPADSVIMYDWTSMAYQAIGRGTRKETIDGFKAHFILTSCNKEVSLFQNTVIKNSKLLADSFGKRIEQLLSLDQGKVALEDD